MAETENTEGLFENTLRHNFVPIEVYEKLYQRPHVRYGPNLLNTLLFKSFLQSVFQCLSLSIALLWLVSKDLQETFIKCLHTLLTQIITSQALLFECKKYLLDERRILISPRVQTLEIGGSVSYFDNWAVEFLDVLQIEGDIFKGQNHFDSSGKPLGEPELDVILDALLILTEEIRLVDENDQIPIELRIHLQLSTDHIQPMTQKYPETLLVWMDAFLQVENLPQVAQNVQEDHEVGSLVREDVDEVGKNDVLIVLGANFEMKINPATHELLHAHSLLEGHHNGLVISIVSQKLFQGRVNGIELSLA